MIYDKSALFDEMFPAFSVDVSNITYSRDTRRFLNRQEGSMSETSNDDCTSAQDAQRVKPSLLAHRLVHSDLATRAWRMECRRPTSYFGLACPLLKPLIIEVPRPELPALCAQSVTKRASAKNTTHFSGLMWMCVLQVPPPFPLAQSSG